MATNLIKAGPTCMIPTTGRDVCKGRPTVAVKCSDGFVLVCAVCFPHVRNMALMNRVTLEYLTLDQENPKCLPS